MMASWESASDSNLIWHGFCSFMSCFNANSFTKGTGAFMWYCMGNFMWHCTNTFKLHHVGDFTECLSGRDRVREVEVR